MMTQSEARYVRKVEDLPADGLVALINDSYTTDHGYRDSGSDTVGFMSVVWLGSRESALAWIKEQDESARRYSSSAKPYKIVSFKELQVCRTVSWGLE